MLDLIHYTDLFQFFYLNVKTALIFCYTKKVWFISSSQNINISIDFINKLLFVANGKIVLFNCIFIIKYIMQVFSLIVLLIKN